MSDNDVQTSENVFFVEYDETRRLIAVLTAETSTPSDRTEALTRLRSIFDKYLECPSLLDPYLQEFVTLLTEKAQVNLDNVENDNAHVFSALYALSKVRGRKRLLKFFPHEARQVEPVLTALQKAELSPSCLETGPQSWESAYILWIWMEMLSLVPFDCSVLSSSNDKENALVPSLVVLAKTHLSLAGPVREAAASCLASWLNRPEVSEELDKFVEYSHAVLRDYQTTNNHVLLTMGVLETLAKLLKCSTHNAVYLKMEPLWETALSIAESEQHSNIMMTRLLVKWFSRMACAYLPPRIATWRYQRGRRSLLENVTTQQASSNDGSTTTTIQQYDCHKEELFHVPDQVEDAMGIVLQSLTDASTVVRWSAAKGVGRMTERLPAICADDVLDYIVELTRDPEKDNAWHGACLALAELARRGLLLPERLVDVVPLLVKAIQYDVKRGQCSVGSHVRDAACYTYWAFARAYAPSILKPFVPDLSRSIVLAFLFDREVNCRRAASAAFQECVGRQGANNFKHGISILTTADYFSLGNITNAYTSVALHVAQFPEYQCDVIDHLYKVKLSHWDIAIRKLASKTLYGITPLNVERLRSMAVPYLVEHGLNEDLHVRHGAVLGLAEVMLALGEMEKNSFEDFDYETLESVVELLAGIEKARLYRGRGGEIMRSAVCRLIECISKAKVPLAVKQQVRYLDSIDACLKHPNEDIQKAAADALFFLMRNYFPVRENGPSDRLQKRVVDKYVNIVNTSVNPAETRGFTLALGSLPSKLLAPSSSVLSSVLDCLFNAARYDARVGNEADAETRRNAVLSIARICETVGVGCCKGDSSENDIGPTVTLSSDMVGDVYAAFLLALDDYNVDRRGDVGSWSRVAAMRGLESLTYATVSFMCLESENANERPWFDESMCVRVLGGLLKQFSEKLDSVRSHAGGCLSRMLTCSSPTIPFVPSKDYLLEILQLNPQNGGSLKVTNWANPAITYRMAMEAAEIAELFPCVVSGIIISVGGLGESVSRYSEEALLTWIRKPSATNTTVDRPTRLAHELVGLFRRNQRKRRIILPLLKTLDKLLNRGCLNHLIHVENSTFCTSLLTCIMSEANGCGDVHTHLATVAVSLGLLSSHHNETLNNQLLAFICSMLDHRFPRVRRFTADHFYVRLLEDNEILNKPEKLDTVLQVLLQAPWDSDMNRKDVHQLSAGLADMIGITLVSDVGDEVTLHAKRKDRVVVDEFASYASLVNSRS